MAIGDQPAIAVRRPGHQRLEVIVGQAAAFQTDGLQVVAVGTARVHTVTHPARVFEMPRHNGLCRQGHIPERPGELGHGVSIKSLGHPPRIAGDLGFQCRRADPQGADVIEGVAADLVARLEQGLQVIYRKLALADVFAVTQATGDKIGRQHAMILKDRACHLPRALGKVIEADAEDAPRNADRHWLLAQNTGGSAANGIGQIAHNNVYLRQS